LVGVHGEALPHAPRLFRLALWFLNRADAEDVAQDTMMQALKCFTYQPGTNCQPGSSRSAAHRQIGVERRADRFWWIPTTASRRPCRLSHRTQN
jgi:DNA-directed RNA polymerase specialized sigma24 family protein